MRTFRVRLFTVCFVAMFCLLCHSNLMAQENTPVAFTPAKDHVQIWAMRAGLAVMVFSLLLNIFVLVMHRGRLMESQAKWLLFFGLCVLPIPVMFLSNSVGVEVSKEVKFCQSCHEPMGPFVDDMMDPNSRSMAAIHYKNRLIQTKQCWTCHTDYGVAGTARAKLTGLIHISKYALDTWEPPIMQPHPYQWTICLECHAEAASFKAEPFHKGSVEAVLRGEGRCTACHRMAHPGRMERSRR